MRACRLDQNLAALAAYLHCPWIQSPLFHRDRSSRTTGRPSPWMKKNIWVEHWILCSCPSQLPRMNPVLALPLTKCKRHHTRINSSKHHLDNLASMTHPSRIDKLPWIDLLKDDKFFLLPQNHMRNYLPGHHVMNQGDVVGLLPLLWLRSLAALALDPQGIPSRGHWMMSNKLIHQIVNPCTCSRRKSLSMLKCLYLNSLYLKKRDLRGGLITFSRQKWE